MRRHHWVHHSRIITEFVLILCCFSVRNHAIAWNQFVVVSGLMCFVVCDLITVVQELISEVAVVVVSDLMSDRVAESDVAR